MDKNKNSIFFDEEDDKNNDSLFDFAPIGVVTDSDKKTTKDKLNKILKEDFLEDFEDVEFKKPQLTRKAFQEPEVQKEEILKPRENILFEEKPSTPNVVEVKGDIDSSKVKSLIESALYVCGNEGISLNDIKKLTELHSTEIRKILKDMTNEYDNDQSRGITIKIFGERYKLMSKSENREDLSKLITLKYRNPLSNKVMETLAIIAYNQPCTKGIIQDIRGKDPTGAVQKLLDLELIIEAGRSDAPGRPFLYTVTHKFYNIFGIKNISDLPTINLEQPFLDEEVSFFDTNRINE
ncbi:MAG: SMC-Scp complex subunit ScpB [Mycoplasma sp.]